MCQHNLQHVNSLVPNILLITFWYLIFGEQFWIGHFSWIISGLLNLVCIQNTFANILLITLQIIRYMWQQLPRTKSRISTTWLKFVSLMPLLTCKLISDSMHLIVIDFLQIIITYSRHLVNDESMNKLSIMFTKKSRDDDHLF